MRTSVLQPANRPTGVDIARDAVRDAILRGEFGAGGRLTLSDIAEQLGTSVTPVREALRDLAAEGLVDLDPHRGARVHAPTEAEMHETYALRLMLEPRAMAEVAALPEEERAEVCVNAAKLSRRMSAESDAAAWAALNRDFHAQIAAPLRTSWPRLYSMVETLRNVSLLPVASALARDPDLMRQADYNHKDLVEAVERGEPERASAITARHLERTRRVLLGETPEP
jgi:DNA-binding GntR family transcriptional regulator